MNLTLLGYRPPARFDGVPWTAARLEQASTSGGSYTEVETIVLNPVDLDPREPALRGLTTVLATAGNWYRVVWVDANGDESDPTDPVQVADVETPLATRTELQALLKITNPDATTIAALDRVLLAASGEVLNEIGADELSGWQAALAAEVTLERAAEHWAQLKSPFGFVGLGGLEMGAPAVAARDSFDRHAYKLAPLKTTWGIA